MVDSFPLLLYQNHGKHELYLFVFSDSPEQPGLYLTKLYATVNNECSLYGRRFCLWHAFPAYSNVCGKGQEPTLKGMEGKLG